MQLQKQEEGTQSKQEIPMRALHGSETSQT